jgi:hypothetical protein
LPAGEKFSIETSLFSMGPESVAAATRPTKGNPDKALNPTMK